MAYTHNFKFDVNGKEISGEVDFSDKGGKGYKTEGPVEWGGANESKCLDRFLDELHRTFHIFGGITDIRVKEKAE